jgi:hypothetical protein
MSGRMTPTDRENCIHSESLRLRRDNDNGQS